MKVEFFRIGLTLKHNEFMDAKPNFDLKIGLDN